MTRRRPSVLDLRFENPRLAMVGVEVLSLEQLRNKAKPSLFEAPQRVDFHHLLLIQEGRAEHMVDFVAHGLGPGAVLFVRPGQVQQWRLPAAVQGQLVLISGEALSPSVARSDVEMRLLALAQWPAVSKPSRALFRAALDDIGRLAADVERFEGTDVEAAIIRHELLALLFRLARELRSVIPIPDATRDAEIYALFQKEVETTYAKRLSVLDYARRLGFSESTLSRACVAMVGRTAKAEVDGRVVLEAKRLLVHSQYTAVQIAHQLGFTEPTNFLKFFKRTAGCTPMEFRQTHTAGRTLAEVQNNVGR